ncbi:MAG: hypothetical protein EPO68_03140 [Planctomycetota bacterium]|nr:MAG: hypothetical protein EPO68_03140 [Planctomycetota bacterium]
MNKFHSLARTGFAFTALLSVAQAQTALLAEKGPLVPTAQLPQFGRGLALSSDRLFVGSPGAGTWQLPIGGMQVYERAPSGEWNPTATLQAPAPNPGDEYGFAVASSGAWMIVGAPSDQPTGASLQTGVAYVYQRQPDASWSLHAELAPPNGKFADIAGAAVVLRPGRALVAAPQRDFSTYDEGAAYLFELGPSGQWTQSAELRATTPVTHAYLGLSAALQGDRALLGAPGAGSGTAHVFERLASGVWSEVATLQAPDPTHSDMFGAALALDGERAAVGAYKHSHQGVKRGAVYLYERSAGGAWNFVQELRSDNGTPGEQFGWSVALEGDALLVGAPGNNETVALSGRAYRFLRDAAGVWKQSDVFAMPALQQGAGYGLSAVLADGRCAVAAPFAAAGGVQVGRVFVYDPTPLDASDSRLSLAQGGAISFELDAGFAHAGELALLLGSTSGALPGQVIAPGVLLPLNADAYFLYTLAQPNHAPLSGSLQVLGAGGAGSASFTLPAGTSASLVGTTVHHAFATIALATGTATFASNARGIALVP